MAGLVLTLNAGSSSIKFALFPPSGGQALARGRVEGLGTVPRIKAGLEAGPVEEHALDIPAGLQPHQGATDAILHWIGRALPAARVAAVGHRVVHGGQHFDRPVVIDDGVLADLRRLASLAPLHQPHNIAGIEAARAAFPDALQVACFDTAFHRGHAFVADAYALPRRFHDAGIRRYGFHGLSYEYIARRLGEIAPAEAAAGVVVAHLGNGASMCAMRNGRSVASTMGFTALDGLPMGTRCGQIDPGVLLHLMDEHGFTAASLTALLYGESGLKGLSGVSSDMRALLASDDPHAGEAVDYFVHRIVVELGALAAALQGIAAVVFTAGIGENAAVIRERVLQDSAWLGIRLDAAANAAGALEISAPGSAVKAFVIRTDEEAMIAEHTLAVAGLRPPAADA